MIVKALQKNFHKHLTPSKSMQKRIIMILRKYILIFRPLCIFAVRKRFRIHNDIKSGKEVKTIMVVDTSLHSIKLNLLD